jgi:hypothetical protein
MTPADLQALITGANGAIIDGGGQMITFPSTFQYTPNAKFRNFKFDFPFNGIGMQPIGAASAPVVPNSSLPKGFIQIGFNSPCGLAASDLLFIKSADLWGTTEIVSQWAQVASISPDGLTVTLKAGLSYAFTVGIQITKIVLNESRFEQCEFTGLGAQNTQKLLSPKYGTMWLDHCSFDQTGHSGIEFITCYDVGGVGNSFKHAKGLDAYGMCFANGTEFIHFTDTTGDDLGHLWTFGGVSGINRNAVMVNNIMYNARKALVDTHTSADLVACLGLTGSHAVGAVAEAVMMQGARCLVTGVQLVEAAGGMVSQPMTRLDDDWCELHGNLGLITSPSAQPAFLLENRKPGGSLARFAVSGSARAPRGLIIKNVAATDVKRVHADVDVVSDGNAAQIIQTGTGKLLNVDLHGSYECTNPAVENIVADAASVGGIDGVKLHGRAIGGWCGVRNIGNAANVRVADGQTITNPANRKTFGPVTLAAA